MDSNTIKGGFLGAGVLILMLVIGLFVFQYFSQKVATQDTLINVVVVSNADNTEELGVVYVDMGELVSTVESADFKTYFDTNKSALAKAEYKYTSKTLNDDGSVSEVEVTTTINDEDFVIGLQQKMSEDMKDKYEFNVDEYVLQ